MKVLWIAWRELTAQFTTAVGWMVLTAWLLMTGVFWVLGVTSYAARYAESVYDPYAAEQLQLTSLIGEFFGSCTIVVIMLAPAVSMGLFAREQQQHTLELLLTAPISTAEIVLGKYLGAMGFFGVLLLATFPFPMSLWAWAEPHWTMFGLGYGTMLLLGSVMLSMGMLVSSFTRSQIIACVVSLGVGLGLFLVGVFAESPDEFIHKLGLVPHLSDLLIGVVRLSDVVYFVAVSVVLLFCTHQRLESFRWS